MPYPDIEELIDGLKNDKIEDIDNEINIITDSINEALECENFYRLPMKLFLKIVRESNITEMNTIKKLIKNTVLIKEEKSILLLNEIKSFGTLDECLEVIFMFERCPICAQIKKIFKNESNLPVRDYEGEISYLQKNIDELKQIIKEKKIPSERIIEVDSKHIINKNIFEAAKKGDLQSVKYLVEVSKVDPTEKDKYGFTAAHFAAEFNQLEVFKYLNEVNSDLSTAKDNFGNEPIHCAARKGSLDIIKYLIEECSLNSELPDRNERTPLHIAAGRGYLNVVKYLITNCNSNLIMDKFEKDPLYAAVENGHLHIVKYICENKDYSKDELLNIAIINGQLPIIKYFVNSQKVEVTKQSLKCAAQCNDIETKNMIQAFLNEHETEN